MKITTIDTIAPLTPLQGGADRAAPLAGPRNKPDRVSLSPAALTLQKKDMERIEALASQIADGTYSVNLDQLAEAIVRKESL